MKWRVVSYHGEPFVWAQFAYEVDALEYKRNTSKEFREFMKIEKIGEVNGES